MAGKHEGPKMKASTRRYIYGICLALGPIAVAYGLITGEQWTLYAALITSIVAPGLAVNNIHGEKTNE